MPRLLRLLPFATVVIDKAEKPQYERFVPKSNLWIRKAGPNCDCNQASNFILENAPEECCVIVDDGLRFIQSLVGYERKIADPNDIYAIIENSYLACVDLDLSTFVWNHRNETSQEIEFQPIAPTGVAASAYGVMPSARDRRFDESLGSLGSLDFSLKTLMDDRLIYQDARFHFNCAGGSFASKTQGGAKADAKTAESALRERWGKYIASAKKSRKKTGGGQNPVEIAAKRSR